ncbi:Snap-25 synaptosome-associated protein component of snare complex [Caligus rogercresseyi]|uniref:Snap-25 synaptosome-associated protein component of snare complex n=1 Tax=Caligus rogercresseyi TaxID=217165 RepID=A0A7T8QV80_CALRO|nr:Snap-25 synaptosome-associated protein component of snare complex [Caligus rogercresseyi]
MGLSRLKVLAHGLNKEMDEHNGILDRIDDGVGKNAWRIEKQNKDMSKLLKK